MQQNPIRSGEHALDSAAPLVWTVKEAGRMLGISRAHAYELIARGELPHLRLGRRLVVPKYALQELLARGGAT